MRLHRPALIAAAVVGLTAGTAAPVGAESATSRPVKRVLADNFRFCKYSAGQCTDADTGHRTKVKVGTRVKWIYYDDQCDAIPLCPGHNVKFRHHHKSATVKEDGAVIYSMVFNSVGKFRYWCTLHEQQGMTGKVVVVAG